MPSVRLNDFQVCWSKFQTSWHFTEIIFERMLLRKTRTPFLNTISLYIHRKQLINIINYPVRVQISSTALCSYFIFTNYIWMGPKQCQHTDWLQFLLNHFYSIGILPFWNFIEKIQLFHIVWILLIATHWYYLYSHPHLSFFLKADRSICLIFWIIFFNKTNSWKVLGGFISCTWWSLFLWFDQPVVIITRSPYMDVSLVIPITYHQEILQ